MPPKLGWQVWEAHLNCSPRRILPVSTKLPTSIPGVWAWGMGSAPGCSSWRLTRVPHTMLVIPICPALGVAEGCPILQMGKVEAVPQLLASLGVLLEP